MAFLHKKSNSFTNDRWRRNFKKPESVSYEKRNRCKPLSQIESTPESAVKFLQAMFKIDAKKCGIRRYFELFEQNAMRFKVIIDLWFPCALQLIPAIMPDIYYDDYDYYKRNLIANFQYDPQDIPSNDNCQLQNFHEEWNSPSSIFKKLRPERECFYCGEVGHLKKYCRYRNFDARKENYDRSSKYSNHRSEYKNMSPNGSQKVLNSYIEAPATLKDAESNWHNIGKLSGTKPRNVVKSSSESSQSTSERIIVSPTVALNEMEQNFEINRKVNLDWEGNIFTKVSNQSCSSLEAIKIKRKEEQLRKEFENFNESFLESVKFIFEEDWKEQQRVVEAKDMMFETSPSVLNIEEDGVEPQDELVGEVSREIVKESEEKECQVIQEKVAMKNKEKDDCQANRVSFEVGILKEVIAQPKCQVETLHADNFPSNNHISNEISANIKQVKPFPKKNIAKNGSVQKIINWRKFNAEMKRKKYCFRNSAKQRVQLKYSTNKFSPKFIDARVKQNQKRFRGKLLYLRKKVKMKFLRAKSDFDHVTEANKRRCKIYVPFWKKYIANKVRLKEKLSNCLKKQRSLVVGRVVKICHIINQWNWKFRKRIVVIKEDKVQIIGEIGPWNWKSRKKFYCKNIKNIPLETGA